MYADTEVTYWYLKTFLRNVQVFRLVIMKVGFFLDCSSPVFHFTEERSTLFRSNTLATTMMDKYMKTTANAFVQHAIKKVVLKIMDAKYSCEVSATINEMCQSHLK